MEGTTVLDFVNTLGALGIIAVYFLYTQPRMQSETMQTFKEIVREFHAISVEQNKDFGLRVKDALDKADQICRYQG